MTCTECRGGEAHIKVLACAVHGHAVCIHVYMLFIVLLVRPGAVIESIIGILSIDKGDDIEVVVLDASNSTYTNTVKCRHSIVAALH